MASDDDTWLVWLDRQTMPDGKYDAAFHANDDDPDALDVPTLMRLLAPGDAVLWADGDEGRRQPLTIQSMAFAVDKPLDLGYWEGGAAWSVAGPRGGDYRLANWWHYDADDAEYGDPASLYPQALRTTDGAFEKDAMLDRLVVLANTTAGNQWAASLDDPGEAAMVVWQPPGWDEPVTGRVVDCEYGRPVVDDIRPRDRPRQAVDPGHVLAYRLDHDGGDE